MTKEEEKKMEGGGGVSYIKNVAQVGLSVASM